MKNHPFAFPLNPSLISSFLAVAHCRKIAAAAKLLNLSQPAVTSQIAKLESDLQFSLFFRSVHGVELTPDGQKFLHYAQEISRLLLQAAEMKKDKTAKIRRLSIAASTTIGNHVLPPILASFAKLHPETAFQLDVLSTDDVIEKIHRREAAIGLVEGFSRAGQVRLERFLPDEIFVVAHPELRKKILRVEDLKHYPFIWREKRSGTRIVVEKALRGHFEKRDISFQYELGSTEAIKEAVKAKLGVGFLSRWSMENELGSGKLSILNLEGLRIERDFSWVYPAAALGPDERAFVDFAKNYMRD